MAIPASHAGASAELLAMLGLGMDKGGTGPLELLYLQSRPAHRPSIRTDRPHHTPSWKHRTNTANLLTKEKKSSEEEQMT